MLHHLWFGFTVRWIVGKTSTRRCICLSVAAEGESGVMRGIRSLNNIPVSVVLISV